MGSVEEEDWYHGLLPRDDVTCLLPNQGDYLVRMSEPTLGEPKQLIISICIQSMTKASPAVVKHFKVEVLSGKFTIDGSVTGTTVGALLDDYKQQKKSLSPAYEALLKRPVVRASWELLHEDVEIGEKIGEGTFGSVNKGLLKLPHRAPITVAIKCAKTEEVDKEKVREMMKEARLMRNMDHPNIVKIYGVAIVHEPLLIIMEFISGGDLRSYVKKQERSPEEKLKLICNAAWGVEYLHSKSCIHRDLAARNCLMGKNRQVKISDFGLSRMGENYTIQTVRMIPIRWIAPEILKSNTFSPKSDVWSFGVLMWEVYANGEEPFKGMANSEVKEMIVKGQTNPIPKSCPPEVAGIMHHKCWEIRVENRGTMSEIARALEKLGGLKAPTPIVEPPTSTRKSQISQAKARGKPTGGASKKTRKKK